MSKYARAIFIVLFLFVSLAFSFGKDPIKASVDKTKITTGEIFTYSLSIDDDYLQATLIPPDFKGLNVVSYRQSKSFNSIDKKTKTIHTISYFLFAQNPGAITIKPAILKVSEKEYKTSSITLKVEGIPLEQKLKILPYIEKGTNL